MVTTANKIKRCLLLLAPWKNSCDIPRQCILKSREITLPTKVRKVKTVVFLVVMYGCESWTIKKAERQTIDVFRLVLEKTLESPLDSIEIKPVNPKGNQPRLFIEYLKGLLLQIKLQYFGHLLRRPTYWKRPWCWERFRARGEGGHKGWDGWITSLTLWTWVWETQGDSERQGSLVCCS